MTDTTGIFLQTLIDVPEQISELAVMLVEKAGAKGVEIRDYSTLPPPGQGPVPFGRSHVLAWMDPDIDRERLSGTMLADLEIAWRNGDYEGMPGCRIAFSTVNAEDWVSKFRDMIKPVDIGRRIRIRPSWSEKIDNGRTDEIEIVLDPGLAFGTGHHATTALCLEAIESILESTDKVRFSTTLLDVGTGSGILAIAAVMMGAKRCVGIDNDPMAVRVATENAEANGVGDSIGITIDPPQTLDEQFDIVVANIHLGPLTEMAPQVVARVKPGGSLILSGLLEDQADEAESAYTKEGLIAKDRRILDGWAMVDMVLA